MRGGEAWHKLMAGGAAAVPGIERSAEASTPASEARPPSEVHVGQPEVGCTPRSEAIVEQAEEQGETGGDEVRAKLMAGVRCGETEEDVEQRVEPLARP